MGTSLIVNLVALYLRWKVIAVPPLVYIILDLLVASALLGSGVAGLFDWIGFPLGLVASSFALSAGYGFRQSYSGNPGSTFANMLPMLTNEFVYQFPTIRRRHLNDSIL